MKKTIVLLLLGLMIVPVFAGRWGIRPNFGLGYELGIDTSDSTAFSKSFKFGVGFVYEEDDQFTETIIDLSYSYLRSRGSESFEQIKNDASVESLSYHDFSLRAFVIGKGGYSYDENNKKIPGSGEKFPLGFGFGLSSDFCFFQ